MVRVAEDRATDRLRELAFLGWQMVSAQAGSKAPTFDKYLAALGLSRRRSISARDRARMVARARRNFAAALAAFDSPKAGGSP